MFVDAIMELDYMALAELKSYVDPPSVVFDVMKATLMVLGDDYRRMPVRAYT